jgi:hypothetical protein
MAPTGRAAKVGQPLKQIMLGSQENLITKNVVDFVLQNKYIKKNHFIVDDISMI